MHVEPFSDQYGAVAALTGRSAEDLRARDAARPARRWLARDGGEVVAVASAITRPDRRTFVTFAGDTSGYGALTEAAAGALRRPLHARADCAAGDVLGVLAAAGFSAEIVTEAFRIGFADARGALRHARGARWFRVVPAAAVDPGRLFTLDVAVRQDVPGTDGWRGDRAMFLDELDDPAAYAVAIDDTTAELAGLARMWRNPTGPRFGLVGVLRQYRGSPVGPALIRTVLDEAAGWGHDSFVTETSLTNQALHPRLERVAAERIGKQVQLRRPVTLV